MLSLSALFFHYRHKDDFLHGAGEEDGVCWGGDLRKNAVVFEHGGFDFFWHYKDFAHGQLLWLPEVIMNVVMFVPIGFALGLAFRKTKGWQAVLAGMGISVGIELLQYFFRKGFADIDDVMHNTLGCAMGWLMYWIAIKVVGRETTHSKPAKL